ncbi:MAG: DUF1492 domain-containing protein [Bacilli bacterium]|nr:DUF1492 domain-containing protein [Bacilli bacterium]
MDKELLYLPHKIRKDIHLLNLRMDEFEMLSNTIPTGSFDEPRVDKSRSQEAPFVKWIYKKMEVEEEIKRLEDKLNNLLEQLIQAINQIDNSDYQNILILRYLNEVKMEDIASRLFLSVRTTYRYKYLAVKEFEKLTCSVML